MPHLIKHLHFQDFQIWNLVQPAVLQVWKLKATRFPQPIMFPLSVYLVLSLGI